jgi:hypothetical protein
VITLRLVRHQKNLRSRSSSGSKTRNEPDAGTWHGRKSDTAANRVARERIGMPTCEVCGNEYDKAFEIVVGGERHTLDSFEFAIHALLPVCPHWNCRIVGHSVEADGNLLLCPLRTRGRQNAIEGPRLNVAAVDIVAVDLHRSAAIDLMRLDLSRGAK